jgi:hypothetical protein
VWRFGHSGDWYAGIAFCDSLFAVLHEDEVLKQQVISRRAAGYAFIL